MGAAASEAIFVTDGTVAVSVEVTNIGGRDADEVVQLYVHQASGWASRPVRELKGFRRVGCGPVKPPWSSSYSAASN